MKNPEYTKLKNRLDKLEEQLNDIDSSELESKFFALEEEISINLEMCHKSEAGAFQKLVKRISVIKREYDFYDEEAELDGMFPDRHDDDFDEDSMSYDSVFGGD